MLILRVVLNRGQFCPRGHICQISSDIFDCYKLGAATCIQWTESRDPAKHPTVQDRAPQQRLGSQCQQFCGETPWEAGTVSVCLRKQ